MRHHALHYRLHCPRSLHLYEAICMCLCCLVPTRSYQQDRPICIGLISIPSSSRLHYDSSYTSEPCYLLSRVVCEQMLSMRRVSDPGPIAASDRKIEAEIREEEEAAKEEAAKFQGCYADILSTLCHLLPHKVLTFSIVSFVLLDCLLACVLQF